VISAAILEGLPNIILFQHNENLSCKRINYLNEMKIFITIFILLALLIPSREILSQSIPVDSSTVSINVTEKNSVYHVNRYVQGAIILGGLATDYPAIGRIKNKPDISNTEIAALNPGEIDPFDKWALNQNPNNAPMYNNISNYGQIPIFMLPGFLLFDKQIKNDWLDILYMYFEGHVLTFTLYNYSFFGPSFEAQYRPITYYSQLSLSARENGDNRNSFYSGHTASCAYATFFMVKVYCDYNPDLGGTKYLFYTLAAIPPLFIGYCRVMSLNHFPSDCMVGLALGGTMGIIIPSLHKNKCNNISFGVYTPPGAAGLTCLLTIPSKK
jgi:membrane-associated phospholipid phosphatase